LRHSVEYFRTVYILKTHLLQRKGMFSALEALRDALYESTTTTTTTTTQ